MPVRDIALAEDDSIYLASGATTGLPYQPQIASKFKNSAKGLTEAVLAKFSSSGEMLWGMYVGGTLAETHENSVRVDSKGNVFFLCSSFSTDAQTTRRPHAGALDFHLTKWTSEGELLWATFVGGSAGDGLETHNLAVDPSGSAYIAAQTHSVDFPVTDGSIFRGAGTGTGVLANYKGDCAIAKVSSEGEILKAIYLGGSKGEACEGVDVGSGYLHVTGATSSLDLWTDAAAMQRSYGGGNLDSFYGMLTLDLQLKTFTYFGGSSNDFGRTLAASDHGVVFGGPSFSSDLKTTTEYKGRGDGFICF
jgi:hypothetical protein